MANQPPPEALTAINGSAERILAGESVFALVKSNEAHTLSGHAAIIYDDGTPDLVQLADFLTGALYAVQTWTPSPEPFKATKNGWVVSLMVQQSNRDSSTIVRGTVWVSVQIGSDPATARACIGCGWIFSRGGYVTLDFNDPEGGAIWPFGGGVSAQLNFTITRTVAGTFICDIVPGAGNEFVAQTWIVSCTGTNSGQVSHQISANSTLIGLWDNLASAASIIMSGPQSATNTTTSSQVIDTTELLTRLVAGTESMNVFQNTGGATDTCQVLVDLRVKGALPIVTNSGTGTYTVTAGSIVPVIKG